ncbi:MAG: peptide-methionine (S)-S-oxide reductase MsrA [Planctomycetes bacterium]|nr:peptide-methionine (S)-S-oxide reductase MsrA [Planctomycetota bacterium]
MMTLASTLLVIATLAAQEPQSPQPPQPMPPIPEPRAEHRWLQQLVGDWTMTSQAPAGQDGASASMPFTESVRSIGGLWIQGEHRSDFGGTPFTGLMTLGYDPRQQAFVGTWIDTTSSHLWIYRGSLDAERNILTLHAEGPRMDDPTRLAQFRDVLELVTPDHRTLTSSIQGEDGSWTEFMQADYRRAGTVETATFAAGCFWCVEAVLERLDGVTAVASGYMGGHVDDPTYEQVCGKKTGHAEVVQVTFDPRTIPYSELLDYFFQLHDPTTKDRQGNDIGPQYRSALFFHSEQQRRTALAAIEKWQPKFQDPIVTEVTAASTFWPAEGYHQDYWQKNPRNPYCNAFIPGKLKKLGLDKEKVKAK